MREKHLLNGEKKLHLKGQLRRLFEDKYLTSAVKFLSFQKRNVMLTTYIVLWSILTEL
jgi:hypothetical protein